MTERSFRERARLQWAGELGAADKSHPACLLVPLFRTRPNELPNAPCGPSERILFRIRGNVISLLADNLFERIVVTRVIVWQVARPKGDRWLGDD